MSLLSKLTALLAAITTLTDDDIPKPTLTVPTDGTDVLGSVDAPIYIVSTPGGAAGGDLTGTYPNPTIAAGALSADASGRAKVAASFFDAATVAAKFDTDSISAANLVQLVADGAFAASAAARALFATDFFDAATVAAKFATDSISAANLLQLVADGAFAASAAARALFADGFLPGAKSTQFVSTEQTATGVAQNVAHGLGYTPTLVYATITGSDGNPFDVTEGVHDGTNVVVTVTPAGTTFKVVAW